MKPSDITFQVISDLYVAGRTEDGTDFTAEVYFVGAEHVSGRRWTHRATFPGCQRVTDDEGFPRFLDVRAQAMDDAERLKRQIQRYVAANGFDAHKWIEAPAAYGSDAYGMQDEAARYDEDESAAGQSVLNASLAADFPGYFYR